MRLLPCANSIYVILIALISIVVAARSNKAKDAVKLENIKALTFKKDQLTTARRVTAIPQLECIGGSAKGLYEPETVRCVNSGSSYDAANVEWTCTASLPVDFKLGSTDVICEGYDNADDEHILKGSCGLEYRLVLTDAGQEKYGSKQKADYRKSARSSAKDDHDNNDERGVSILFWAIFVGVVIWMLWKVFGPSSDGHVARRPPGSGGSGGSGYGNDNDDPPPPYSPQPPRKATYANSSTRRRAAGGGEGGGLLGNLAQGFRPGFWTGTAAGAGAGAAAGYMAGSRQSRTQQAPGSSWFNTNNARQNDPGEGSWRGARGGTGTSNVFSSSSSPSYSSDRHESTGFGGTRRR